MAKPLIFDLMNKIQQLESEVQELKTTTIKNKLEILSDLNKTDLVTGLFYADGNTANAPHPSAWFILHMNREGAETITQIAYRYRDNEIYERQYNTISGTGWKAWEQLH